jgi:4-amino-4-deoxy-L-arabinose transferase-like glycosyltransferase
MLIVIPLLTFIALFLWFADRDGFDGYGIAKWGRAFLAATVAWAIALLILSEILSLMGGINRLGLSLGWLFVLLLILALLWRKGTLRKTVARIRSAFRFEEPFDVFMVASLGLIVGALFLISVISPPNNVDSLKYHMARVMHWAANENLRPFATANTKELFNPIWAEAAILHLRVLWGDDRPANLVQWFSMVGSLVAVASIGGILGAGRRGKWLAVAYAVSIPIAILQASSTQTDYVVAFWCITLMFFVLLSKTGKFELADAILLSGALGLGMLTKGTFYLYAIPILIWYFIPRILKVNFKRYIGEGALIAFVAIVINLGFWARNVEVFGTPFARPGAGIGGRERKLVEMLLPGIASGRNPAVHAPPDQYFVVPTPTAEPTPPGLIPTAVPEAPSTGTAPTTVSYRIPDPIRIRLIYLARMLGQNVVGPKISGPALEVMRAFPDVFDDVYIGNISDGLWNHEDTAGNPIHLLIVPVALILIAFVSKGPDRRSNLIYAGIALSSYGMLALYSGSTHAFAVRYQLPFFILWSPLVGSSFSRVSGRWVTIVMSVLFLLIALPYVFINNAKPLVGMPAERTRVKSILVESKANIMFESIQHIQDEYFDVRNDILENGCQNVGLVIDETHLEYLFWWMLDAPQSGIRIESLSPSPELVTYMEDDFQACAVICTVCSGINEVGGLPVKKDFGYIQLFSAD